MQSRLPLHLAATIILFALFFAPAAHGQADRLLPPSWNDAVNQLADRVAATVNPSTPVSIEVKNISAIEASDENYIEGDFENALRRHSLTIYPPGSSAIRLAVPLRLNLSESASAYIWIVQIFNSPRDPNSFSSAIVSVPKTTGYASTSGLPVVSLERRLVWEQPDEFLDFAIVKDFAVGDAGLLVLESNRLALYKLSGSKWLLSRENPIPPKSSLSRAPGGTIDTKAGYIYVAGLKCTAGTSLTGDLNCIPLQSRPALIMHFDIRGLPHTLGTPLSGTCLDEMISLYTGEGDWTQADIIQGYLTKFLSLSIGPSGGAIQFDGPVISLQSDPETSSARTVVHNLKTGNYEGYIVTATCSH